MTPGGVIASSAVTTFAFPPPPIGTATAATVTFTFPTPFPLPNTTTAGPGADIYVGLAFPAAPSWPADGIALLASGNELMSATAVGYTGTAGISGLGWDCDTTLGTVALAVSNRAWPVTLITTSDSLQLFADNPAVFTGGANGLNPNFGYAGLWPDVNRPDGIGFNVRTGAGVGSTAHFFVTGPSLLPAPVSVVGVGILCIDPNITIPAPLTPIASLPTVAPPTGSAAMSQASLGPVLIPGATGLTVHCQVLTINGITGALSLSNVVTLRT
jgi:hypothetical protein